jgi:hypothetical protein
MAKPAATIALISKSFFTMMHSLGVDVWGGPRRT